MKGTYFSVIIGLFNLFLVNSQYAQSPCPGVFEYQSDGYSVYGVIRLKPNGPVPSVFTVANFTVATRLPTSYVGRIEPYGSDLLLQQFNQGSPITYRVDFPVTSPLPHVTSITANDNVVCYGPGDIPGPNQYVTTISLQHMLFQKPGTPGSGGFNKGPGFNLVSSINKVQSRPKPNQVYELLDQFGSQLGSDTQVFTFNEDGDGNFNQTPFDPYVVPQTQQQPSFQRPQKQPNQPPPQPNQATIRLPDSQYYPEQTTNTVIQPLPAPPAPPPTQPPPRPQAPALPDVGCGIVSGGNEHVPLIFNGQSYSRGDWPWLVAIYRRKEGSLTFTCGGTLISNKHVVTAAHCMRQKNSYSSIKDIVVKVGVYNLEDWGDDTTVTRTLASASVHESYNASTLENDILVFTLDRTVEFNTNIRAACLWSGNTDQSRIIGASGVVAGWGRNELGQGGQGEPRMVRIPIVSTSTCRASNAKLHSLTSAKTLCAGDKMGSGPCLGDSGGGLYIIEDGRWRIRGVVSISLRPQSGETTCDLNEYVVFTDTAQYIKWIQGVMAATAFT